MNMLTPSLHLHNIAYVRATSFFPQSRLELYMHAFMGATASQNNSEVAA